MHFAYFFRIPSDREAASLGAVVVFTADAHVALVCHRVLIPFAKTVGKYPFLPLAESGCSAAVSRQWPSACG